MVDDVPGERPPSPAGSCRACSAPVAGDQRYCLECGTRVGERRLEPLAVLAARGGDVGPPPAAPSRVPPRAVPLAAAATAILVAGVSGALVTGDGGARAALVARAPATAPAPAPATATEAEAPAADTGDADDAADTAAVDEAPVAEETAAVDEAVAAEAPVEEAATDTATDEAASDEGSDDTSDAAAEEEAAPITPHVWLLAVQGPRAQEAVDRVSDRGVRLTALKPVSPSVADSASALITGVRPAAAGADPAATPAADPAAAPSLPEALTAAEQTWRTYVDVQPKGQTALSGICAAGAGDPTAALLAARSPFRTIAALQENGLCAKGVRSLEALGDDVSSGEIPSFSYVALGGCAPPDRSVVALPDQVDDTVTAITESTEYQESGLVVVTSVGTDDPCPVAGAPVVPAAPAPETVPTVVMKQDATVGKKLKTAGDLLALPRLVATTLGVSAPGVAGAEDVPALELPGVESPAATD